MKSIINQSLLIFLICLDCYCIGAQSNPDHFFHPGPNASHLGIGNLCKNCHNHEGCFEVDENGYVTLTFNLISNSDELPSIFNLQIWESTNSGNILYNSDIDSDGKFELLQYHEDAVKGCQYFVFTFDIRLKLGKFCYFSGSGAGIDASFNTPDGGYLTDIYPNMFDSDCYHHKAYTTLENDPNKYEYYELSIPSGLSEYFVNNQISEDQEASFIPTSQIELCCDNYSEVSQVISSKLELYQNPHYGNNSMIRSYSNGLVTLSKPNVHPNPFSNYIYFDQSLYKSFQLFDLKGKYMDEYFQVTASGIETSSLPQGIYILRLNQANSFESIKLIKI